MVKIQNKTEWQKIIERRETLIRELNAQYKEAYPEYSVWQRAVRIEQDLICNTPDDDPRIRVKRHQVRNIIKRLGIE